MVKHSYHPSDAEDYYVPPAELFEETVFDTTYVEPEVEDWTEPEYGEYYPMFEENYVLPFTEDEQVWSNSYLEPGFM